ncbi:MAG: hypothetical protein KBC27_00110 [Rickettsiales bacterium]|nr:hypothetical protein [Rickettsiales bacterium]
MNDIYKQNKEVQEAQFQKKLAEKRAQIEARKLKEAEEQKHGKPHADPFNMDSLIANAETKQSGSVPSVRGTKKASTEHQR